MFASTFYLEREPLTFAQLPGALQTWAQNAGGVAALLLVILWIVEQGRKENRVLRNNPVAVLCCFVAALCYGAMGLIFVGFQLGAVGLAGLLPSVAPGGKATIGDYLLTGGGVLALVAVLLPILAACLTRLSWRRIWAIARVSLKEAQRKRVVLVFAAMGLIYLYGEWFIRTKPEAQLRTYVSIIYFSIMTLFLLTAGLLGAFSIPNDVKNQSIHTIVTKPVEKFEIVLGRFLGYAILLTVGLAVIGCLSLVYVLRGVNPDAAYESQKARVPIYGGLEFFDTEGGTSYSQVKGVSVGREWEYRRYISGPQPKQKKTSNHYARWKFQDLPAELGARDGPVTFEFTFDIFRLNKGVEGKGVACNFLFVDGRLPLLMVEKTITKVREERTQKQQAALANKAITADEMEQAFTRINEELIEKYGIVELAGKDVTDFHTQALEIPSVFFKHLQDLENSKPRAAQPGMESPPMMYVLVSVTSFQQMLGMAQRDFYLLADEGSFEINFLKGILGMWCVFMMVLGMAISCSTYLSGVISWMVTMFLVGTGLITEFIQQVALGTSYGGGPAEAFYKLMTRTPLAGNLEGSPVSGIIGGMDDVARWVLRRFLNMVPDITRHNLRPYVASGFDIPWVQVLLLDNFLVLAGYLLPWAILAFYLMKFREIANPT